MRELILKELEHLPEGAVVSAKALLHLGTRAAVDQALSRLARSGELLRAGRGRYMLPVTTRFGVRAPTPAKVVESLAEMSGETVVPSGAASANALGLTTQVPVRSVYLTSGRSRHLRVGGQVVELRHAPTWQLRTAGHAGPAVRALAWLGRGQAHTAAQTLAKTLPESERQALVNARAGMPTWLAQTVSETFLPRTARERRVALG
jgi:hypothetical protein